MPKPGKLSMTLAVQGNFGRQCVNSGGETGGIISRGQGRLTHRWGTVLGIYSAEVQLNTTRHPQQRAFPSLARAAGCCQLGWAAALRIAVGLVFYTRQFAVSYSDRAGSLCQTYPMKVSHG